MENADLNPMPMFNSSSTEQTRPDEIYIRSDHPDANDFIMVGGRCYKKTADESESYEITSENIFAGLLEKKDTLVVNPVEKPESATETRQDLAFSKFEDCPDCVDVGVRFRGQQKKNYRDFIIKVVKENDDATGGVVTYRMQGEDRNGKFKWTGDKTLSFYDTDSVTFDIQALGSESSKFTISNGLSPNTSIKPGFVVLGSPRYDTMLVDNPEFVEKKLVIGSFSYSESGGTITGEITVVKNPFTPNPEYADEKLKQFPDRLHCSRNHSFVIKNDGRVFATGQNDHYSLGIRRDQRIDTKHNWISVWTESEINKMGPIKKIVGSNASTAFLTNDNKLYMCGYNATGNLSNGGTGDVSIPSMVKINHPNKDTDDILLSEDIHTQIVDIGVGNYHTVALDVNQRLWVWGNPNIHGSNIIKYNNAGKKANGGRDPIYQEGINYNPYDYGRKRANSKQNTHAYLAYWDDDLARDTKAATLTDPNIFELGIPDNKIYSVSCGYYNTFILTLDGAVFSCGYNAEGQLGQNHMDRPTDIGQANGLHASFNKVYDTGGKLPGDSFDDTKIHVKKVIPGARHTLLLTHDNKLYGFGRNDHGQLGVELDAAYSNKPVLLAENVYRAFAGSNSSAYIRLDGKVFVSGYNLNGKLGIDRFSETSPIPSALKSSEEIEYWTECNRLMGALEIKMGNFHTIGMLSNGELVGFGETGLGQLGAINHAIREGSAKGDVYEKVFDIDFPRAIGQITEFGRNPKFDLRKRTMLAGLGCSHTIIWSKESSTEPNRLEATGWNGNKQLGYTDEKATDHVLNELSTKIAPVFENNADILDIKNNHQSQTLILNSENRLFMLGQDSGGFDLQSTAKEITYLGSPIENVKMMSTGVYHSVAVDGSNRLYGWGNPNIHGTLFKENNNAGKLHNGGRDQDYQEALNYNVYDYGRKRANSKTFGIQILNDGEETIMPEYVGNIIDVQCSWYGTFILNDRGEIFSTGFNKNGELGQGHAGHYTDISQNRGIHTSFGRVFSFDGIRDVRVKRMIIGARTHFAILEDNSLYGWGRNDVYQLGLSELNTIDKTHHEVYYRPTLIDINVDDVFVGVNNTAVKKLDGSIYCMGRNTSGLLAMFGDGRALGLDRWNPVDQEVSSTRYAKLPTPWFDASDNIIEIAFGTHHSIIKQVDRTSNQIHYYSAGNNYYGQRGIELHTPGGDKDGNWNAAYDNANGDYKGSDRWMRMRSIVYA